MVTKSEQRDWAAIVERGWHAGCMESDEWVELEWLEGPPAQRSNWEGYIHEKYPDLTGYNDADFRIDVVCGRDGVDRVRLLRRREPSQRAPRKKPRWH